jgi:uncharacterized protein (DUF885 family)
VQASAFFLKKEAKNFYLNGLVDSMQTRLTAIFATALVLCGAAPDKRLASVLAEYDAWMIQADPIGAAQRGDEAAAHRWPDDSPTAHTALMKQLVAINTHLQAVPAAGLQGEDALNRSLLDWRIQQDLAADRFDEDRIPYASDQGFFTLPAYPAEATRPRTAAQAHAWIDRLRALPAFYATEAANLQRGIDTGFVLPKPIALNQAKAARAMANVPAANDPLLAPLDALPASLPLAERQALKLEALSIIAAAVKPAQQTLAAFYQNAYVPHARDTLGAASLPNGRAYYAMLVRRETTTNLSPDQIFAIGQSEIARIRTAMNTQIAAAGFHGSFAEFQQMLRTDKRFYVTSKEELLAQASRLAKRVDGQLPHFFGKLPRLPYGVAPVPADIEEGFTTARYDEGSPTQGIAGELWINTSHLDQRPLYELPALVAHEGAPGHHIQIALAQELSDLPAFRRDTEITAFAEGWALYSEQLADELGLYETPYEKFGQLSLEMWRACRLVMDVGIHWKGWSRDQALSCLRENTALSETNMQNEVDRYIAWPGQALGYKIGELKIMELRHRAEAAKGAAFDERAFHDLVIDEGAMPLAVLEQRVDAWIKK